ncbi:hypothetical protein F52700_4134 [Fusarium sp. NRRL 52700]|nr:hypothetical protein F52700_4134 [Fusarium sp. NRRL 52700]
MVAIRSFLILSAAAGLAYAGKCKPESRSSSTVSAIDTASASATLIESTTAEQSLTETASSATSADVSTTESIPTTFLTSFTTLYTSIIGTTTSEAATTTTTLAPADPTCPSTVEQCAGDFAVLCDVQLSDLELAGFSKDILECASFCEDDDTCAGFSRVRSSGGCFKAITLIVGITQTDKEGWDSGIKGSCGQQTKPTTTSFTSDAETTTTEVATTTTAAGCPPEIPDCPLSPY